METIEELKKEATDLGIKFSANIGADTLKTKIEEYYKSQETSGEEIEAAIAANEKSEEKSAENGNKSKLSLGERINKAKQAAMKTRVISIIDNDQRVNNQTTSCTVNCSNAYFDLGQIVLPLNTPVEVRQGHINVIKDVKIPQHIKGSDGTASVVMRPRYTISYEDVN